MIKNERKIIIVGDSCRGKTSLANKMGNMLDIPVHHIDDYYFIKKYSVLRDHKETLDIVLPIYDTDSWIVEGATKGFLVPGMKKADIILHLHFDNIFHQIWHILVRNYRKQDSSIKSMLELIKHVIYIRYQLGYKKGEKHWPEIVAESSTRVVHLGSWRKIRRFLEAIEKENAQ